MQLRPVFVADRCWGRYLAPRLREHYRVFVPVNRRGLTRLIFDLGEGRDFQQPAKRRIFKMLLACGKKSSSGVLAVAPVVAAHDHLASRLFGGVFELHLQSTLLIFLLFSHSADRSLARARGSNGATARSARHTGRGRGSFSAAGEGRAGARGRDGRRRSP